jgi:hypothetical protein
MSLASTPANSDRSTRTPTSVPRPPTTRPDAVSRIPPPSTVARIRRGDAPKLKKALAFDSQDVSGVIEDLDLLNKRPVLRVTANEHEYFRVD